MKNRDNKSEIAKLRQKVEKLLKKEPLKSVSQLSEAETLNLIHELEVHQIEMELINEELHRSKIEAEAVNSKYTELYDFAPIGYFTLSKEGKIVELNLSGANMLGKERSYLKNCSLGFFISDDTKPIFNLFLNKVCNGKAKESCEVTLLTDGNLPRYVYFSGILTKNGEHCLVTALDITEIKQAETALRKSEERFRSLYENATIGMYRTTSDGRILMANPSMVRMLGFDSFEQLAQRNLEKEGYEPDYPRSRFLDAMEKHDKISGMESAWHKRDGNTLFIRESACAIRDAQGQILYYDGTVEDITERKRAEEELIKSKNKAEESDKLKTAFLHNISHEIRTPMNAIVGFSTLLREPDVDAQSRQSYIEIIMQSSNHLLAIITDIVDFSNIEANLVKIVKNEIDANSTLKSLCDQFLPKACGKKIKLVCETGLSDSDASVLTDGTKLTQILSNLINNAIKFTGKGYVKVGCTLKGKFLEFYVSDTGIGISREYHERIFDRFYQVQNTVTKAYEGTGLGLPISKAYIEMLGGKIWLKSAPGKGTTFYFTVPVEKSAAAGEAGPENITPEKLVLKNKKTILIAEDIDSNFRLIKYFLSDSNIEIVKAANGKEAVEKCLSERNIDLVLMDIKMPVMDGYTAAKLILASRPGIPIIAQTAYADDKSKAIESGCSGFISKPFDKEQLLRIIREFI